MIYLIRSGDFVKIGKANDPWGRLADLQTSHYNDLELLAVMPGDAGAEAVLHRSFARYSRRGEWFDASAAILAFAVIIKRSFPDLQRRRAVPVKRLKVEKRSDSIPNDFDKKGWRIERRYRAQADGTTVMYWNYRRRSINHVDGKQRVEYRPGGKQVIDAAPPTQEATP
jgi:hypothetical protein